MYSLRLVDGSRVVFQLESSLVLVNVTVNLALVYAGVGAIATKVKCAHRDLALFEIWCMRIFEILYTILRTPLDGDGVLWKDISGGLRPQAPALAGTVHDTVRRSGCLT